MTTKRQKEIMTYLIKSYPNWVTSTELAGFCGCTTRTIRNQVAKINEKDLKIDSSIHGYQLANYETFSPEPLRDTKEDRQVQIFLILLKSSNSGVNLYDLAESLYISESTLKNDIYALQQEMVENRMKVLNKGDTICLEGTERDKRRYMISQLYNEGDYQEKLRYHIQDMIGEISLPDLEQRIRDVLAAHDIKVNQYAINNIVLHFAISIERIRQGNELSVNKESPLNKESNEYQLSKEIANMLSELYDIIFSDSEVQQLALLFFGLHNENLANKKNSHLDDFVDSRILDTLSEVLKEIKKTYLIDLQDEAFFNKLAIHLQSLYDRSQFAHFTRNSNLLDIKTAYPLTYDIAVYMSMLLQDKLAIWFNEDEISFIALHLGAYLECRKDNDINMRVLVDVNDYHDFETTNIQNLKSILGEDIEIIEIKHQLVDIRNYDIYLTSNRERCLKIEGAVYVHPVLTRKDIEKVQKRITTKKKSYRKNKMFCLIDRFIVEDLYFGQVDGLLNDSKNVRLRMYERMLDTAYVGGSFLETMEKRESMSPTSFPSGIAVPHSIEQNAYKSAISIMTLQESLMWHEYPVKMVALVAISQKESKEFNYFFETFIEIVSDPINVKELANADNFSDFILTLKMLVETETELF